MEHEERIRLLLHPEQYSDEQLQQLLADDPELAELLDELTLTKQALVGRETAEETIPVEEEWQKFQAKHSKELMHLTASKIPYKMAASFIGILFTMGVAFAAVQWAASPHPSRGSGETTAATDTNVVRTKTPLPPEGTGEAPTVFDNTPLEKMLPQIATYYNKEVEFANDGARQLRFYFVWKPEEGLEATLHRLNLFERVNIELKDNKIIVE